MKRKSEIVYIREALSVLDISLCTLIEWRNSKPGFPAFVPIKGTVPGRRKVGCSRAEFEAFLKTRAASKWLRPTRKEYAERKAAQ